MALPFGWLVAAQQQLGHADDGLSGVRNSWLILARNCAVARADASARSRSRRSAASAARRAVTSV